MTSSERPPLRPGLLGQVPYGAPQLDVPVLLNVNENPYPPSPAVVDSIADAVRGAAATLNRYPDREFRSLRTALAGYLMAESGATGLTADQLWAANGSNEIMTQVLQAFGGPGATVLSFAPTYSMYPEYARNTLTGWRTMPRRPDFTIDQDAALSEIARVQPAVVFLASPNNPTGTALPPDLVSAICTAADGVVVVDEAYAEFRRPGTASATTLLREHHNLAVSRTMSKAFALAGARVGYLVTSSEIVDAMRIVRLPYHLSAVTQAVAGAALAHADELLGQVARLRDERDRTRTRLLERGFVVAESDANFLLFGMFDDRHAVWQGMLDRGVLIRETGPEGWLRVSIGTSDEMIAFFDALTEVA